MDDKTMESGAPLEASLRRKQAFERLRKELGLKHGFVKALASELNASPSMLGKALSLKDLEERHHLPGYAFSAGLARKLEGHFGLVHQQLESGSAHSNSETPGLGAFERQVIEAMRQRYESPHGQFFVKQASHEDANFGSHSVAVDIAVENSAGRRLMVCDCVSRSAPSERQVSRHLSSLMLAAQLSESPIAVLATRVLGSKGDGSIEFHIFEVDECGARVLSELPSYEALRSY